MLFGGSFGVTIAQSFVLVACLESIGVHLPVLTIVAVFLAGNESDYVTGSTYYVDGGLTQQVTKY